MLRRVGQGVVTAGAVLYSTLLLGWLLLRAAQGEAWPMVGMLNAVGIWWFAPLLLLLPLAGLLRARQALYMGLLLAIPGVALFGGDLLPARTPAAPPEATVVRVLSFNTLASNHRYEAVIATIRESDPDIVAIQELNLEMAAAISNGLREEYPYQLLAPWQDPRGIGLWSRYPLVEGPSLSRNYWDNWAQTMLVDVGGRSLTLFHVHMWPIGTLDRREFARLLAIQHGQIEELTGLLAQVEGPLLLVGDFNASPTNESYGRIAALMEDGWRSAGSGPGFTFPDPVLTRWPTPFLRIDYQWYRGGVRPLRLRVLPGDSGSDHLPLLGEYLLP